MKTPSSNNQRALEHPLLITSDYTDIGTTLFQNIQREAKKARCAFWYAIVLVCLNLLGWSNRGEAAPVTFYVADSSFGHLTGRPDEYGCWSANTDQDAAGYLVYGPYTTAVSPGVNAASFQLMIDNTTADNLVVATIDVFDATTGIQLASKDITRTEFASPYAYKSFTLNFTAQANHRMEFRTFWYDRAYMRQSSVDVTDTLYIYTLGGAYNSSGYDEAVAVASLQGVINRNSPTLYVKTAAAYLPPQYWLNKFSVPGGWLAGRTQVPCTDLNALVALAGTKVKEVVVWDPNVPATVNVATTIAGVRDAVVVSPDQLAQFPAHWGLPIFYDLRNKFTGSGTVNYDGVSFASTGSKKNDAYRWAIEKYLKTGLCSKTLLCYFEDSYFRASNGVCPNGVIDYAVTRDWAVKNRSFVYDLSPWGDVVPKDDPYQPLGTDLATYKLMLGALLNQTAGTIMTEICGFFSFTKYGSESPHGDVATEWETVHLISHYNAYQNTVADSCFNQSLHSQAPVSFPLSNTRPAVQLPLEHKSYICIFMGDYDSAAPLYETLPLGIGSGSIWDDPQRGSIPLVWGVNPNLINTYPDLIKYYYDTKSPNDYFAADASCAGYMNPSRIQEQYLPLFIAHNKSYYGKLDMTISPMVLDWEQPSSKVKDAFAQFSPDGYSTILWHHFNGYVQPVGEYVVPQVWNGMPILALQDVGPLQDVVPNPNFISII